MIHSTIAILVSIILVIILFLRLPPVAIMDVQLTNRLLALGYKDEPSITRNRTNDCLFLCFVEFCKNTEAKHRKFTVTNDGQYLAFYPTHSNRPILHREQVDISTATGMRLLAADAATYVLSEDTPNAQAPLLKRHILHRFRSAYMRNVDSEMLNGEQLPDDASDGDKIEYWKKLMMLNGASSVCITASHSFTLQRHRNELVSLIDFCTSVARI
jgi:hypothetical protein